ncbi:LuxR C-terminal-related transcriptional regulator [Terracoccus sp. 273MFTsu3.1]|uniref:LuxR C-terminal-related transcriptional regulator n=1 Tax=Terracoccus sp. 273MFTsu3.1 TaxID=1172188 RepID=UPI00035EF475|nr:LuxR C-terminal-related transcriptional regulator [Terracoccus sp. 273MFTsu3.1]
MQSAGVIDRPRLVPLLDRRPVAVLAGMAGFGKSTLLASAVGRQRIRGAGLWLTIDDSDRDPVRLVSDLLSAASLAGIDELTAAIAPLRTSSLRAEPLTLVDALLEALYDTAEPLTLALDDAQHLAGSKASAAVVNHLLRWAPANMRVVIGARVVPPLRLQRLRLDDRLSYLAHDQLAFTPDETALVVKSAGLDLDPEIVASIHEATGGWPAGVRMAMLAARQIDRPGNVPLELRRDQALADYLATEVLASLPDELRDFVLDSCLDEHVCPSLLDSIRGTTTAEMLLEQCLSEGIFLSRSTASTDEPWFSWHPLFATHVRRRLATDRPERAAELHAAAAAWWVHLDPPTAMRHALAAGDGVKAAQIFSEHWLALFLEGRVDAVMHAIEHLPHDLADHPDVHLVKALVFVRGGRLDAARAEVAAARTRTELLPRPAKERFEERTALVDLFLTGHDQGLQTAVDTGEALLERLAHGDRVPDPAVQASVQAFVGMGEARLQGRPEVPLEMLRASAATAHDTDLVALELTALAESCIPAIAEGRLTEVQDLAVDVLDRAAERGWVGLVTLAPAVTYLGWLDYWRGNLAQARTQLERSLSMMVPFDTELRGLTLNFHAKTCLALGDVKAARASMSEISAMNRSAPVPPWWPSMLAGLEGLALVAEGKTSEALALASSTPTEPEYRLASAHRARVLLRGGEAAAALTELDQGRISSTFVHVTCLSRCIEAEALAALGRNDAHASLELALAAAEPDQLYGPFLAGGKRMAGLLKAHLRHGTSHPAALTQVLARLAREHEHGVPGWGERLTDRERVILQYLATNLTNAEIAEAEFISLHTTKTHIAHIYQKLGVGSRRAAIRRAADLDLY